MDAKRCPHCNLVNPASALQCDCGHRFAALSLTCPRCQKTSPGSTMICECGHDFAAEVLGRPQPGAPAPHQLRQPEQRIAEGLRLTAIDLTIGQWFFVCLKFGVALWLVGLLLSIPTYLGYLLLFAASAVSR